MRHTLLILIVSLLSGQSKYPADSLLASSHVSIIQKIGLLPIAGWQRISYNTNFFNCQFYPSCSNFGANSIKKYGTWFGTIIAADRINRCNPSALHYHSKIDGSFSDRDGRLIDFVDPKNYYPSDKSPTIAAALSIIPGLGKLYSGRFYDGLYSIFNLAIAWETSSIAIKNQRKILGPFFLGSFTILYAAEIYGSWRATKYYQPPNNKTIK